jgi:membrane protein implicated in regulation of membrane protease activity
MSPWLWLALGGALCLAEVVFPTAYIELMMGMSALVVAIISLKFGNALLQACLWLGLSILLVAVTRRFAPKRSAPSLNDAVEAQTLTVIPPGKTGRVLYEGNSWQARCQDQTLEIPPNTKVFVISRQGTTLMVMPQKAINS